MSERGRGSEPPVDDLDGGDAAEPAEAAELPTPPTAPRPIAPYDPYRPSGPVSRRNVAAEEVDLRRSRGGDRSPFLPDDDPLNAEAWQLELGEIDEAGDEPVFEAVEPDRESGSAPRQPRRQTASARARREGGAASTKAARRARAETAPRQRPAVTLTIPRAVSGTSLASDQTMLLLLGINIASILIMALVLAVRLGGLPDPMVLRLDAAGNPALWGSPRVLWRLPLMSLFITAMFLAFAWFFHAHDRFAARFALTAAVVAQLVAWAAVFLHLA